MFKRFSLWSAAVFFTGSVFAVISLGTLSLLLRPGYIKSWGERSGAYQKLPAVLISQAAKEQSKEQGQDSTDGLTFADAGVQDAARSALTPSFLQKSTEQVVDGSFAWLDSKSDKPTFSIDVLSVKQDFVDNLGNYLKKRYSALPACAPGVMPTSTDLLKINCRPSSELLDIDQAISAQKLKLLENKDFLPETTISADTLQEESTNNADVFNKNEVPRAYRAFQLSPFVFAGLALVSGLIVVVLCESKKFGVRKLGWRLVVAGSVALVLTIVGFILLTKVRGLALHQPADSGISPYKDIVAGLITAARSDIAKLSGIFSIVPILIGGLVLFLTRDVSRKAQKQKNKDETPSSKLATEPEKSVAPAPTETEKPTPTAPVLEAKPRPVKRKLIQ